MTMQTRVSALTTSGLNLEKLTNNRSLTLHSTIPQPQDNIPIYTSPETYTAISTIFPYMIDSKLATGGGATPSFRWHPFDTSLPFTIPSCGGIGVIPLPVEHGTCMGFRIGGMSYISDANRI